MTRIKVFAIAIAMIAGGGQAYAGLVNDVPSCYAANHYAFKSAAYTKLAYILVDQTVVLDPELQREAVNSAVKLLGPGTKFVIAEFSAFSQDRYLDVLNTGIIESPMTKSERENVPVRTLGPFDGCMNGQARFSIGMVQKGMQTAMQGSSDTLAQSDIMMALKTVSSAVAQDPAQQKVVFVVTDGLENSSVTSFYLNHGVRMIDPSKEMDKASANHMFGNFAGASVYMMGVGVMPPAKVGTRAERDGYRDPKTLNSLDGFWKRYFDASHAKLREVGNPALVSPPSF